MKKIVVIAIIINIILMLGIVANAETYGDLTYTVSNGEITITDCNTSAIVVNIPNEISAYPVTAIGDKAFANCVNLTNVTIPDSVIEIGESVFKGCNSMETMSIPKAIYGEDEASRFGYLFGYEIKGEGSRNGYPAINEEYTDGNKVPNGKTYQNYTDFYYTKDNWDISANKAYTNYIRRYYYYNIPETLKKVIITKDSTIAESAFCNCVNIEKVVLNKEIKSIGYNAFYNCSNLKTVYFDGSEEEWNEITISNGNDYLLNATKKYFVYVTVLGENGETIIDDALGENSILSIPEKKGYVAKLYTDVECTNEFDITSTITKNLTLYLRYKPIETNTTVLEYGKFKSFTITPSNMANGNIIFLALYDGERLVEAHTDIYEGEDITFITDVVYTDARVMAWEDFDSLEPICTPETVE